MIHEGKIFYVGAAMLRHAGSFPVISIKVCGTRIEESDCQLGG